MFIINLFPYFARNNPVSYSWVGAVAALKFGADKVILIGTKLQLLPPSKQKHAAWIDDQVKSLSDDDWAKVVKIEVPDSLLVPSYDLSGSGLTYFNTVTSTVISEYENYLYEKIHSIKKLDILGGISFVNDPSFGLACEKNGLQVIYTEGGPIRLPNYNFGTYFFDFGGVNGANTFDSLVASSISSLKKELFLSKSDFQAELFPNLKDDVLKHELSYEIGVALQVEDDSNLISFSNDVDSIGILYKSLWIFPAEKILIREHPLSKFKINTSEFGDVDLSNNSYEFLLKCKRLFTINSSVAFEALLLGKPAYVLGKSPLNSFAQSSVDRNLLGNGVASVDIFERVNIFFFLYLIPDWFWMDYDYYTWRLSSPSNQEIFEFNLKSYRDRGYFLKN